jgi:type IV pilus assembly protein PilY1
MRTTSKLSVAALRSISGLGVLVAAGNAGVAHAQTIDVSRPMPNVMLLLDTSGSMEKMTTGKDANCAAGDKNRWGAAVESLTGTIYSASASAAKYGCYEMSRQVANVANKGPVFNAEYAHNGKAPYDAEYYLPFHRPASDTCVYGPGFAPGVAGPTGAGGSVLDFNVGGAKPSIITRDYAATPLQPSGILPTACAFNQFNNGVLDTSSDIIRFGLMTFDSDTNPGTGVIGTGSSVTVPAFGTSSSKGTWSYFFNWDNGGTAATGVPAFCADNLATSFIEIGARNPAAPPWEGRLIGLPSGAGGDETVATVQANSEKIQLAVNAMRPWGATPIAGMVKDAQTYYWDDPSGPKADPYVTGGCRKEYIILITDGAPNLDLRPSCAVTPANPAGHCPYAKTEDTVANLYNKTAGAQVTTYVIGFAVSDASDNPVACSDVVLPGGSLDASKCTDAKYATCCELERIALAGSGGTKSAFFAEDPSALSSKLAAVVADITAKTTTRTVPAYSPVVADVPDATTGGTNSSLYLASLFPTPSKPWSGNITRQRYVCDSTSFPPLTSPTPVATKGDDFGADLNSHTGRPRQFMVVQPTGTATTSGILRVQPTGVAVPNDGLGIATGTVSALSTDTAAIAAVTPTSMGVTVSGASSTNPQCANMTSTQHLTGSDCKELALRFAFGSSAGPGGLNSTFRPFQSRYDNAFGDIFHASPVVVGTPDALIRDESYQTFRATWAPTLTPPKRPTVMYAATNDGLLHAFDTGVSVQESNEIWAFLPPAVMPQVLATYPATHALLLDGAPIVKDAVWDRTAATLTSATNWHSTLVASYGTQGRGYYALDVTDPDPTNSHTAGPKFLWQLTNMPTEIGPVGPARQLFGTRSGTPAITTVFIDSGSPLAKHEVGVAILPGGMEGAADSSCGGANPDRRVRAGVDIDPATNFAMPKPGFVPRTEVRCWPAAGRSLTVVRLDNGEILRTFVLDKTKDAPKVLVAKNLVNNAPIYAPLVGTPLVYPGTVGAVAQRVYIGDAEGTVLRFDLSDPNPANWRGDIFFDTAAYTAEAWNAGQPIAVPPVLALDRAGRVLIEVATGDQETYTSSGNNFVWSLSETLSAETPPRLRATPNWFLKFQNGKRVTGPMAIFDGTFYFATFTPESGGAAKCGGGTPEIYGRDFITPNGVLADGLGGIPRFNLPGALGPIPDSVSPTVNAADSIGKLVPGVTINLPPTCAQTSVQSDDPYVPGAKHFEATSVSSSPPKLTFQLAGVKGTSDALKTEIDLKQPVLATTVDSWAAVVE